MGGLWYDTETMELRLVVALLVLCGVWCDEGNEKEDVECVQKWTKEGLTKRFTIQQLQWMCQQHRRLRQMSSAQRDPSVAPTKSQMVYLDRIQTTFREPLARQHTQELSMESKKALRKEFRTLSEAERTALAKAFNRLKSTKIDGTSKYDLIASWHYPDQAPGAHSGPGFLPWHREFLRRMELALREEDPDVAIPYWDSTLDHDLPDPRDSVLWTEGYFGNGDGRVTSGPFANWPAAKPLPEQPNVNRLFRKVGGSPFGALLRPSDLDWVYSRQTFAQLTMCVDPTFELTHGLVHVWVGGYMLDVPVSTNDPVFFFHHAFVDYVWERFRQMRQTAKQRVSEWPQMEQLCSGYHELDAPMAPFAGLKNRDGLSEAYLEKWYGYADSPSECSKEIPDCQSPALWCHVDGPKGRCKAKIRPFGNCAELDGTDACYQSKCSGGICLPEGYSTVSPNIPPLSPLPKPSPASEGDGIVYLKVVMLDENGPMTSGRVQVTAVDSTVPYSYNATPLQTPKFPEYPGLVYAAMPNPALKRVKAMLKAVDAAGSPCKAYCRRRTPGGATFATCDGFVTLSSISEFSDPIPYTASETIRPFLDVDMSLHPNQWTLQPPYIAFLCGQASDLGAITQLTKTTRPNLGDTTKDHVWFHVLVMDGRTPLDRSVPDATVTAASLDNSLPSQYQGKVEATTDFPRYFGVAYVRAPNPAGASQSSIRVRVSATDPLGRPCKPVCDDGSHYEVCKGNVTLSIDGKKSNTFSFSSDDDLKIFLGWDLTGHPTQWRRAVSVLQFLCYI